MSRFCETKVLTTLCSFLVLATTVNSVYAASITAAGEFANRQVVTIDGSGFGVKASPRPLYFWDFGNSVSSADVNSVTHASPLGRLAYGDAIRGTVSSAVVAPGSRTALQVDMGRNERAAGPEGGVTFHSPSVYAWIKHRYNFDVIRARGPNGFNLKVFRIWYPYTHDMYVAYQGSGGSVVGVENTPKDAGLWFHMRPKEGAWVIDEYDYQTGGIGTADGIFQYARNGILAWSPDARFTMRTSAFPQQYQVLFFDQVSNNEVAPGTYQYIDSIYVDDTRQRVIVSDEPTWSMQVDSGTESHREVQIPTVWNDSQIQIVARQGSLDSFANKFLYVIGGDGNPISSKGYPVTPGNAPTAPSAVAVH